MQTRSKAIFNFVTLCALLASLAVGAVIVTPARAAGILFVRPFYNWEGCSSWAMACNLQTAIANSVRGDQIWVQAGTYTPDPSNRTVSFTLNSGVEIYGG